MDEMGPLAAKSFQGHKLVYPPERARQEADYGRRASGYIYGAFIPKSGLAFTRPYYGRTIASWVAFLEQTDAWISEVAPDTQRICAIVDNLSSHHAEPVLLFAASHPRWEFIFQPTRSAYLNLIEPWWKVLRSLALKGKRFDNWQQMASAIDRATCYWNEHRHPFVWGRNRRRKQRSCTIPRLPGCRLGI